MTKARDVSGTPDAVLASGTFTNATAINFTNLLSDTYKFYDLSFYCWANNAGSGQNVYMRFRENTTDVTSTYYQGGVAGVYSGTTSSAYAQNNSSNFQITTAHATATNAPSTVNIRINRPNATAGTIQLQTFDHYNTIGASSAGTRTAMTNFTGFTIFPSSSNISGYYILTGRRV